MAVPVDAEESLAAKFAALFPHLDERQRRLVMGAEARVLGHGGIKVVAAAADVSAVTVSRGVAELEGGGEPLGRARHPGGGRKRVAGTDPGLKDALLALVDPESRGDPESPLRWTTKSTRHLAAALTAAGHPVSAPTVAALLKEESFSLQGNVKTLEGARHADRDAQFRYINAQARDHIDAGDPVISVDAKKKENVGPFKKGGAEWQPKGAPEPVNVHDFIDKELGKVTPYGVYDVAGNAGWVSVGTDHDTAAFAVTTIRTWWDKAGQAAYPDARRLLITADGGGSNGYRTRLWKTGLAAFAAETGLQITVCHLPPGTSKWNKIEHRLFSHISMNWRGRPLTSHEVIVNTIAATTTRTGLTVSAELDTADYPKGIKISDREIQNLEKQNVLRRHDFHGEWNYCLNPPLPPPETSVLFICGRIADRDDPGLAALAEDLDLPPVQVQVTVRWVAGDVPDPGQLREPDAGRLEHGQDRGVTPVREAAALACSPQGGKFSAGEHRYQRGLHRRGTQPFHRVRAVILDGQPAQEPAHRAELVTGICRAVLA